MHYGLWLAAGAVMALVIAVSMQKPKPDRSVEVPSFGQISAIIEARCTVCHSATPSFAGLTSPPLGVVFDRPQDISRQADRIQAQTIATDAMPMGNATGMTGAERAALAAWIAAGAPVK
jgi:uncharacterized membrane protein